MPEGPEVTLLTEKINYDLKNNKLTNILINPKSRYNKKKPIGFEQFIKNIPTKIIFIKNKGKLIYWKFDNGYYMINHLGMSGNWSKLPSKHICLQIEYEYNNILKNKITSNYYFIDQRHFGTVQFIKSESELNKHLNKLGPDMLNDKSLDFDMFSKIMRKNDNKNITKVLMDQSIISGVGNYIKAESLYHSKISPLLKIKDLDNIRLKKLYQSIRNIILSSYNSQSNNIKKLKDVPGTPGLYGFQFSVYNKKQDLYGNKISKTKTPDGRTTHWVPNLQV